MLELLVEIEISSVISVSFCILNFIEVFLMVNILLFIIVVVKLFVEFFIYFFIICNVRSFLILKGVWKEG